MIKYFLLILLIPLILLAQSEISGLQMFDWGDMSEEEMKLLLEELQSLRLDPQPLSKENLVRNAALFPPGIAEKFTILKENVSTWDEMKLAGFKKQEIEFLSQFFAEEKKYRQKLRGDLIISTRKGEVRHSSGWSLRKGKSGFALVTDTDPGELKLWDYKTGYAEYGTSCFKMVIGRLKIRTGLGLLLNMGKSVFLSRNMMQEMGRINHDIQGTVSRLENSYPTGIGVFRQNQGYFLGSFVSITDRDGSIKNKRIILDKSGIHVSAGELEKRKALREKMQGITFVRSSAGYSTGITFLNILTVGNSDSSKSRLYQRAVSFYGTKSFTGNFRSAFEIVFSGKDQTAFVFTGKWKSSMVQIDLSSRYFSSDYNAIYGEYFSALSAGPTDEKGFMLGLKLRPLKGFAVQHLFDISASTGKKSFSGPGISETSLTSFIVSSGSAKLEAEYISRDKSTTQPEAYYTIRDETSLKRFKVKVQVTAPGNILMKIGVNQTQEKADLCQNASAVSWLISRKCENISLAFKTIYYTAEKGNLVYEYLPLIPGAFSIVSVSGKGMITGGSISLEASPGINVYCGFQSGSGFNGAVKMDNYLLSVQISVDL